MTEIIMFHNIVEDNGKTIKENNMEKIHNIPIDSLVEVKYDTWHGNGACEKVHARLWVVSHDRDCDGTPLYTLAEEKLKICNELEEYFGGKYRVKKRTGFSEESLTIVEVTSDLEKGHGCLQWEEGE